MNYTAIADAALACAAELLPRWLPGGRWDGDEYVVCNPTRGDNTPGSFKINRRTGKGADFATNWRGGDLIAVRALVDGCSQPEAAKRLADELGLDTGSSHVMKPGKDSWQPIIPIPADAPLPPEQHPKHGKPTMRWLYRDKEGSPLFWIYRFEFPDTVKKEFVPVSYGKGGWRFKGVPAPRPLYNLHLLAQHPDATVIVCEGEKAADAASQLLPPPAYVATTSPNGANSANKADWSALAGRRVIIWPDNDEPGRHYARIVAGKLSSCKVSVIDPAVFGNRKEGWDAADALAEGMSTETVQQIVTNAKIEQNSNTTRSPYKVIMGKTGQRDGVYFHGKNGEGEDLPPFWVCSPLTITARTNNGEGHNWGYLLEWHDPDNKPHSWAMPAELLAGLGDEYRRELLSGGLEIAPHRSAKSHLTSYIQNISTDKRARCTDRTGWHNGAFVLPHKTLGETGERVLYQSSAIAKHSFKQRGALAEWQENVSKPVIGNSRAVFAISCAFAPALLNAAGEESGGFHFRGESSSGKTKLLSTAASVWGNPEEYIQRWRATSNGLEGIAQLHNDCLLILDELAQVEPKEAGEIAYMLGNGSGKVRASKEGLAKKVARWRLLYLSAGEIGLADHVRVSGKEIKAGQEIRLADIPADAGKGMGVFEKISGNISPADFARSLGDATAKYYGTAGIEFLESILGNLNVLPEWISQEHKKLVKELLPQVASGQVERVAARFAIVGIAGELATYFGITGWEKGEAERAVKTCFTAWLQARGTSGSLEPAKLLSDIRALLEAHSESRFTVLDKDDGRPTINRMGFIRESEIDGREYIILPESFKRELCKGHDPSKATRTLAELGILIHDSDGKPQKRESLPGMARTRCYVLRASKLWESENGS